METKCRYCCPQENQQSKKRKINQDDDMSLNNNLILPLKIMYPQRQTKEISEDVTSKFVSKKQRETKETNWVNVGGKKINGPTNTKNSHLPINVMFSVIEDKRREIQRNKKRREIQRNREVEKVMRQAEKMINKAQPDQGRRVFFSCTMQPPAEFLDDERDLNSSTVEKVKYILQGKSLGQLELVQSEIMSKWRFDSAANSLEYWEMVLKLIHQFKVKNLEKDHAGYGMEEGSGDNFEMMNMTSLWL